MASSYLVLINNVLRDLNEVELTSSNFSASRGIQTAVKDYVNRAIDDIIFISNLINSIFCFAFSALLDVETK